MTFRAGLLYIKLSYMQRTQFAFNLHVPVHRFMDTYAQPQLFLLAVSFVVPLRIWLSLDLYHKAVVIVCF